MKKTTAAIAALTAFCTLTMSLSGCYFFPDEEALLDPPTVKVEDVTYSTYKAAKKDIINQSIASGYVTSELSTDCFFTEKTGKLKTIHVNAGDFVKKGDLIAELNVGDLEYELKKQKLVVQRAQLQYSSTGSADDSLALQIEQNTLEQYQNEYDNSKIFAPCDGQIAFIESMSAGSDVQPYKVIATIVDPENLYIKASVNDGYKFRKGDSVTIKIGDDSFDGTIVKTPKEAQEQGDEDKTSIYAEFKGGLPSFTTIGTIADVVLTMDEIKDAIVIPKYLLKTMSDRTYVELLVDGEKVEVDVEIGVTNATEAQILSGLKAGDTVVVK